MLENLNSTFLAKLEGIGRVKFKRVLFIVGIVVGLFFIIYSFMSKSSDELEKKAILAGLDRLVGGVVVSINWGGKNFVIDRDPLGVHKTNIIKVKNSTEFFLIRYVPILGESEIKIGNRISESNIVGMKTELQPFSFKDLKEGMQVEAHFEKRIDLERAELVASRIDVVEYVDVVDDPSLANSGPDKN